MKRIVYDSLNKEKSYAYEDVIRHHRVPNSDGHCDNAVICDTLQ